MTKTPYLTPPLARILWMDFETTGPDPDVAEPLEVAIMYTDGAGRLLGEASTVFAVPEARLARRFDPWAFDTHTRNGLLEEVRGGTREGTAPEAHVWLPLQVGELLDPQGDLTVGIAPMDIWFGGNNPHYDWRLFRRFCPALVKNLGYRRIDTGTLERTAKMAGVHVPGTCYGRHRARSDIMHSIDVYTWAIARMKGA